MTYDTSWFKWFPSEPGIYWFYGYLHGKISVGREVEPELNIINVKKNLQRTYINM